MTASTRLRLGSVVTTLQGFAVHDFGLGSNSLFVSLMFPLENQLVVTGGLSTDDAGHQSASLSAARTFDAESQGYLRSVAVGVSRSVDSGEGGASASGGYGSATASVQGQWGPLAQSSNLSWSGHGGGTAASTSLSTAYALTREGISFTRDGSSPVGLQLFNDNGGTAGVSVLNRSEEVQKVKVDGRNFEVPARSTRLLPRSPGRVGELLASPGPVAEDGAAPPSAYLDRGNVRVLTIVEGFWAIESFFLQDASGASVALSPERSYKAEGREIVRMYPDRQLRSLVYESRDDSPELTRFITVKGFDAPLRCSAGAAALADGDQASSYRPIRMNCQPAPAAGR
ncbi:hypothetical protein GT347_04155 [Xylophilus rhododendri]|uniref:Uncharacterized protein n=1 Tax=Xylophilus rhododendri TaxID=2697032 RepID=A0A857J2F2_9BURK|nr:hypothetical protein [Xylophilus rhododendri]QHI97241.1 hypothetical protein GT347_04155 [Xylophilus rhododendri]